MKGSQFNYVWLLPLMERPFAQVVRDIQRAIDDRNLPDPVRAGDVSLREIVATGLVSESRHWIGQAVGWIEQGFLLDEGLVALIDGLVEGKQADQATRHRAFALARQWDGDAGKAGL